MRRSKSQIRDEYVRLANCWAYAREFKIAAVQAEGGFFVADNLPTKEDMIAIFDSGDITASQMLSGLKQGLADSVRMVKYSLEAGSPIATEFLQRYQAETERGFFTDAGNPDKIARQVVNRGTIKNELEFYILKEVMCDLEQTIIPKKDTPRAYEMLDSFEFGKDS